MSQQLPENIFYFDPQQIASLQQNWEAIMSLAMWGDVQSDQIGKAPRMRKRLLDLGESLQSFFSSKEWIEQPRQQLKSALGSSIKLRDSLSAFEASKKFIVKGDDLEAFIKACKTLEDELMSLLVQKENDWASALDSLGYSD